jgi:hypothetical protein
MRYREITESAPAYNLQAKYDEFNRFYFNNELPKIPLGFASLKSVGGRVIYQWKKHTYDGHSALVGGSMKLQLSSRWVRTSENLDGILLHEMIHVYLAACRGNFKENHGPNFKAMLSKIRRVSGINVPLTDTVNDLELSDADAIKAVGVLIVNMNTEKTSVMLMSAKTAYQKQKELEILWKNRTAPTVSLYTIATPIWTKFANKFPITRKLEGGGLYYLRDKDALQDLIANGHLLFKIEK